MTSIPPISTSRVTNSMTNDRVTAQLQSAERQLLDLQTQISTGFRVDLPSDDAAASQRAIGMQRAIEQNEQAIINAQGVETTLGTTDAALAGVTSLLNSLNSEALNVVDDFSAEVSRTDFSGSINTTLESLVNTANTEFTGTYLYGGSDTGSAPYVYENGYVEYRGDDSSAQQYTGANFLIDTGVSGDDTFGGLSGPAGAPTDLGVQLTPDTELAAINEGRGVSPNGAITITYDPTLIGQPTTEFVVDLSRAKTVEDVGRLIEAAAPEGSGIVVRVSGDGIRLSSSGGRVVIEEVAEGRTAAELGLPTGTAPAETVQGEPLDPVLDRATALSDLGGVKSRGRLTQPGDNNDLTITAAQNGAEYNGLTIELVAGAAVGAEVATYDDATNTLTVTIDDVETTAAQVAAAINAEGTFVAEPDYRDGPNPTTRGSGLVYAGVTSGVTDNSGAGAPLDFAAGLQVENGEGTYHLDTSEAQTVDQLLSLLNRPEYGLAASIDASGDGIQVRSRRSGVDFAIGENGGTTATDLGLRTSDGSSRLDGFNNGEGVLVEGVNDVDTRVQNDFVISVYEDGVTSTYAIDVLGVETVDDLIARIDTETGGAVAASLAEYGNGLSLVATDPDSPAAPAAGAFSLGGDTVTLTAETTGLAGNRPFTVVVDDTGSAGLATTVVGDTITVNLGGAPSTTDAIAASIEATLPGFTAVSDGVGAVTSADAGSFPAPTTGGAPASSAAVAASGDLPLVGDTLSFVADVTGAPWNQTYTVVLDDTGAGGLSTTISGSTITVDLGGSPSTTDAIATSIDIALPGYSVTSDGTASVATTDTGTQTVTATGGRAIDSITASGAFAERLGLVPSGASSGVSVDGVLTSADRNTMEVESVFNTLLRMDDGLRNNDEAAFARYVDALRTDTDRVNASRAEVGARLQSLESTRFRLDDEQIQLRAALSLELEVDMAEAISDYNAAQYAYEATLQTSSTLLQLSLLDYL